MKRIGWFILLLLSLFLVCNVDANTRLIVVIQPPEAASDARWRLDDEEVWRTSGTVMAGLPEGPHTIEFLDLIGWAKPPDRSVVLTGGRTTLVTGMYMLQGGALQVSIAPPEAVDAGAMWRRMGTDGWKASGEIETGIPAGEYWVEFKGVAGFSTPLPQSVRIIEGEKTLLDVSYSVPEPSLQVLVYPPEAAAHGGQWRVDGGEWHESGYVLKGLSPGNHTIEFKAVPGWRTPPDQVVTTLPGQTTHASGTYTPSATLCVTLAPEEAIDAGARWRMDGGPWLSSGTCVPLPPGSHLVEFRSVEHWTKPPSESVVSIDGETTHISGTYVFSAGCLEVAIEPLEAVNKGARWRVDGGLWFDSGQRVFLSQGEHMIEFCDVSGWTKPAARKVTVPSVECIQLVETYAPAPLSGSLRVTITPPEAIAAGAQWRRQGTSIWLASGETEILSPGPKTVEFKSLSTWTTPPNQDVFIYPGQTVEITGTYGLPGSLSVTIIPAEAVAAGARWRVDDGPWQESGSVRSGLTIGLHKVSFSAVSGWTKPADRTITVGKDTTQAVTGVYKQQAGSLRVTISPSEAVVAGARWRRSGTDAWRESGTTESGIPAGSYTVEFSDVSGWVKPPNKNVLIYNSRATSLSVTYKKKTGSLRVMIGPVEAVTAGAKWRRVGTTLWRNSGTTESGIPVGQYGVEFRTIGGWQTPANQTVTIQEGQTTETTATYAAASGSLKVFITPQEAVDAGAKWRVDSGSWQDSGGTIEGLSVGFHSVSFNTVAGWKSPPNKTVTIVNGETTTVTGNYTQAGN